jgi:hypothetical protein
MKLVCSITDSLQSGLLLILLVSWGAAFGLMYVLRVFYQWAAKIANLRKKTYSGSLVAPFEPALNIESTH